MLTEAKANVCNLLENAVSHMEYLNLQITIYSKIVRELQKKRGLLMPSDIKETLNYLKTFEFEDFDKDNYSETELAACN